MARTGNCCGILPQSGSLTAPSPRGLFWSNAGGPMWASHKGLGGFAAVAAPTDLTVKNKNPGLSQESPGFAYCAKWERSDGALDLVGAKASGTDVYMARSPVDDRLDTLDIGLPHSVGTSVGMGHLDTERHALAANIALCHLLHLQSVGKSIRAPLGAPDAIIPEIFGKCKRKIKNF